MLLNPKTKIAGGKYEVVSLISDEGGFSEIYIIQNTHPRFPAQHVLKINLPSSHICEEPKSSKIYDIAHKLDAKQRTFNEARILAKLNHPNIIRPYDILENIQGRYYGILMEQIKKYQTFNHCAEVFGREKILARATKGDYSSMLGIAVSFCDQLSSAVQYLRENKIIHKDLKPDNIIIDHVSNLKLIDFGLATLVSENNGIFGNRLYSPPEHVFGCQNQNSDLWSLGLLFWKLLSGQFFFDEEDKQQIPSQIDFSNEGKTKDYISRYKRIMKRFPEIFLNDDFKDRCSNRQIEKKVCDLAYIFNEMFNCLNPLPSQRHIDRPDIYLEKNKIRDYFGSLKRTDCFKTALDEKGPIIYELISAYGENFIIDTIDGVVKKFSLPRMVENENRVFFNLNKNDVVGISLEGNIFILTLNFGDSQSETIYLDSDRPENKLNINLYDLKNYQIMGGDCFSDYSFQPHLEFITKKEYLKCVFEEKKENDKIIRKGIIPNHWDFL